MATLASDGCSAYKLDVVVVEFSSHPLTTGKNLIAAGTLKKCENKFSVMSTSVIPKITTALYYSEIHHQS